MRGNEGGVSASRDGNSFRIPGGRKYENNVNILVGFNVRIPAGCTHWDVCARGARAGVGGGCVFCGDVFLTRRRHSSRFTFR